MSIDARLDTLGRRHQELESALHEELRHPAFDDKKVHDIKRRKLAIKDEIQTLQTKRLSS
ncbi:YdcH family protein [Parvularcula oceani]|uniref:YdcH family protein n=1 Tax=Parvularcula oceani TaxID=1247963 RepID=UPI0004E25682|nr:DUF465 domain-containing protein [Parvularcula oceani]